MNAYIAHESQCCQRLLIQQLLCMLEIKVSLNIMLMLKYAQQTDADGNNYLNSLTLYLPPSAFIQHIQLTGQHLIFATGGLMTVVSVVCVF